MFTPEYTITSKTLKNISNIEYGKAIIENTTILPNWQKQLEKESFVRTIFNSLSIQGINTNIEQIKKFIDGISDKTPQEIQNLYNAVQNIKETSSWENLEENHLKNFHSLVGKNILPELRLSIYRSKKMENITDPEEILAKIVELMDWYNSLDAKETHPVITTALLVGRLETISPFEHFNKIISNLMALISLKIFGYEIKNYYCLEDFYNKSKASYEHSLNSIMKKDQDYTLWIEYFTDGMSREISNLKEKVLILARDSKLAKVTGRIKLTERQERVVEHLQDYGILRNSDFPKLFPSVSEDSVLRDLKALISEGLIIKTGSTKSSTYELR